MQPILATIGTIFVILAIHFFFKAKKAVSITRQDGFYAIFSLCLLIAAMSATAAILILSQNESYIAPEESYEEAAQSTPGPASEEIIAPAWNVCKVPGKPTQGLPTPVENICANGNTFRSEK